MVLRGVLDYAFGNIPCLRGFAPLKTIADISKIDENYQRTCDPKHVNAVCNFLNSGKYTFFPELILGVSLETLGCSFDEADDFFKELRGGASFKRKTVGKISASLLCKEFIWKDPELKGKTDILSLYWLEHCADGKPLVRIDGNHRLEAALLANEKTHSYQAPFCLAIFKTDLECRNHGGVFFHNINYRALPIPDEKNLELILDSDYRDEAFSDEILISDPSFGLPYYLTRHILKSSTNELASLLDQKVNAFAPRSFVRDLLHVLFAPFAGNDDEINGQQQESQFHDAKRLLQTYKHPTENLEWFLKDFSDKLRRLAVLMKSNVLLSSRTCSPVIVAALLYFMYYADTSVYRSFLNFVIDNRLQCLHHARLEELIELFSWREERRKRKIFVSMPFGKDVCENHYKTIKRVVEEINDETMAEPKLCVERVDQIITGKTFEINQKIINEIVDCGYLIADLTYCNANVYHEIGLLMGQTLALTNRAEYEMLLLLDKSVPETDCCVKFNLASLQQLHFTQSEDMGAKLKARLKKFYRL